jgi:hypothetical protein
MNGTKKSRKIGEKRSKKKAQGGVNNAITGKESGRIFSDWG